MNFIFLVLHYKTNLITQRCVESILKYDKAKIVIMDNGSNDGTGEMLKKIYKNNKRVFVIISKKNLGFSDGNNFAFDFINRNKVKYDYIICCNNDLIFKQQDFLKRIYEVDKGTKYPIIGPDIIDYNDQEIHQNPLRISARNVDELKKYKDIVEENIKNINVIALKNTIKKVLKIIIRKKSKNSIDYFDYSHEMNNVCLSGSCLIFTPVFFKHYKKLFYPATFFYHEEEILFYRLKNRQMSMLYTPKIKVFHDHSVSTNKSFFSEKEKLLFQYENNLKGCDILINYINGDKYEE